MAVDEYTREIERKIIRELQDENQVLRNLLRKKGITPPESRAFQAAFRDESAFGPDQGGRIISPYINTTRLHKNIGYPIGIPDIFKR